MQQIVNWKTPSGSVLQWVDKLSKESHVLIGGTTGAGKSTLLNYFIYRLLLNAPSENKLILIDPKGCELVEYASLPHTLRHCDNVAECVRGLNEAANLMEKRFRIMKLQKLKQSNEPHVYILIDEWIDLKTQAGKLAEIPTLRLIAKGRAANIHVILCTQRPTREIITGAIRANFPAVVALRCNNKQESRNLIDQQGAELLPLYGQALYKSPSYRQPQLVKVNQIEPETMQNIINFWIKQKPSKRGFFNNQF